MVLNSTNFHCFFSFILGLVFDQSQVCQKTQMFTFSQKALHFFSKKLKKGRGGAKGHLEIFSWIWQFYHMFSSSGTDYTKSFIDTEKALIVYNHNPLASLEGKWTSHEVIYTCLADNNAVVFWTPGWSRAGPDTALQELLHPEREWGLRTISCSHCQGHLCLEVERRCHQE